MISINGYARLLINAHDKRLMTNPVFVTNCAPRSAICYRQQHSPTFKGEYHVTA